MTDWITLREMRNLKMLQLHPPKKKNWFLTEFPVPQLSVHLLSMRATPFNLRANAACNTLQHEGSLPIPLNCPGIRVLPYVHLS